MTSAFGTVRSRTSRPTGTIVAAANALDDLPPTNSDNGRPEKPHRIEPSV